MGPLPTELATVGRRGGVPAVLRGGEAVNEGEIAERHLRQYFIGGRVKDGNFINRGDIEVYYDTDAKIIVEYRKFAIAISELEANGVLDRFHFWSWAKDVPSSPGDLLEESPELECNNEHWNDFGSPKTEARGFINICAESGGKCPVISLP